MLTDTFQQWEIALREAMQFALTNRDYERSQTSRMLPDLDAALSRIAERISSGPLLDIGCGHGGLVMHVGEHLGIDELHGIDLDREAVAGAAARGVSAREWNLQTIPLPYPDSTFAVVTSFGVLSYLSTYDDVLAEIARILKPGGLAILSLPNLASWHNRWMLLRGYQPRDLEVSTRTVVGTHPHYGSPAPVGHVSCVTTRGFVELMENVGFETVDISGASPTPRVAGSSPARLVDWCCRRQPTLARRFIYVGRRPLGHAHADVRHAIPAGWWGRVTMHLPTSPSSTR